MKIGLAQFRVLLAAIVLIASSALAGAGLAEQGLGITAKVGVAAEIAALSMSGSGQVTTHVIATGQDNHHDDCGCHGRQDCVHSAASGCCAASISGIDECGVLDCAPFAARFITGKAFLATGINPEALLRPPQVFA